MWKKQQPSSTPAPSGPANAARPAPSAPSATPQAPQRRGPSPSGKPAYIAAKLVVEGTVSGPEDLVVEGKVKGEIKLPGQQVTVSSGGNVEANIHARAIIVEGRVKGDLKGEETLILRASGQVEGNLSAPSVNLENGARFQGSIDMGQRGAKG